MIVITTPTGDIGHQVLKHVVQGSESVRVIARDPSRIPQEIYNLLESESEAEQDSGHEYGDDEPGGGGSKEEASGDLPKPAMVDPAFAMRMNISPG
jgi:hypothetical protein